jgi:hypothetical protein
MAALISDKDLSNRYSNKPDAYFDMLAEAGIKIEGQGVDDTTCDLRGLSPQELFEALKKYTADEDGQAVYWMRFTGRKPPFTPRLYCVQVDRPAFFKIYLFDEKAWNYVERVGNDYQGHVATMITEVIMGFYKRMIMGIDPRRDHEKEA